MLADVARALRDHHRRTGRLPAALSQLFDPALSYAGDVLPEDGWRGPLEYRVLEPAEGTFRLRSLGPDRRPDTTDDVVYPLGLPWPTDGTVSEPRPAPARPS